MIVKHLEDLMGTEDVVKGETWESRRFLLKKDNVGFSLNDTIIHAGTVSEFWYKNHIEAVYCIEGEGKLEDLDNDKVYTLKPGTLYTLNGHEKHRVTATTKLRMVCVFNPPLTGQETHDEEGAYPLLD
ncbi:MAG: ectoine synthase [Firmicutes bacterium]|uniref:L-ectoine synthase n=1 Tax=Melghirimyces thermohalophilus TaxID=1236220 RepID=A0A1G6MZQ9_9BACL|nr:ectoine synthase [Melghirimyces thermohalophilus]MDA8351665.1 ectoine synthase [Bacillota bacterium]SDC60724.1 ectoine synthase [Melghirimyces thermohalophilus]